MNEKTRDVEIGSRIRKVRQNRKITQLQLAKELGFSQTAIALWESGNRRIPLEIIDGISLILNISASYLLFGDTDFNDEFSPEKAEPELTIKDEKDIAKTLSDTLAQLDAQDGLMFDGEALDDNTKELLRISLENTIRTAKVAAKKKFTPKNTSKDSDN